MKKIYENPKTKVIDLDATAVILQTSGGNFLPNDEDGEAGAKAGGFLDEEIWGLDSESFSH